MKILLLNIKKFFQGPMSLFLIVSISLVASLGFSLLFISIYDAFQTGKENYPLSSLILSYSDFTNYLFMFLSSIVVSVSYSQLHQSHILKLLNSSVLKKAKFFLLQLLSHWALLFICSLPIFFPMFLIYVKFGGSVYLCFSLLAMCLNLLLFTAIADLVSGILRKSFIASVTISFIAMNLIYFFNGISSRVENLMLSDLIDYVSISSHSSHIQRGILNLHDFSYYFGAIALCYLAHSLIQGFEEMNG